MADRAYALTRDEALWEISKAEYGQRVPMLDLADLRSTNLSGTDLSGGNIREADLSDADLTGAYLCGAYLRKANLSGAVRLLTAERVTHKESCLNSDMRIERPASRSGTSWGGKPADKDPDLRARRRKGSESCAPC